MPEAFEVRDLSWRDVSQLEFDAFLRRYPRPLEARPPLPRKANFRQWLDLTLGQWPKSVVAKCWKRGACRGYQVRTDECAQG